MGAINGINIGFFILPFIFGIIGKIVSMRLQNKFAKYSQAPLSSGLSGAEVAAKMLKDHNITDVRIESVPGKLTDHYNPANKTVNLSPEVYQGRSIAAAAVAAHECGHAIQHATAYAWLGMRSKLVPAVNIASKMMRWIVIAGMIGGFAAGGGLGTAIIGLLLVGYGVMMLFSVVTLPVEYDASKRAMVWLDRSHITEYGGEEYKGARDALKWAGMTYFVAALAAVAQFLYFLMIFLRRR